MKELYFIFENVSIYLRTEACVLSAAPAVDWEIDILMELKYQISLNFSLCRTFFYSSITDWFRSSSFSSCNYFLYFWFYFFDLLSIHKSIADINCTYDIDLWIGCNFGGGNELKCYFLRQYGFECRLWCCLVWIFWESRSIYLGFKDIRAWGMISIVRFVWL